MRKIKLIILQKSKQRKPKLQRRLKLTTRSRRKRKISKKMPNRPVKKKNPLNLQKKPQKKTIKRNLLKKLKRVHLRVRKRVKKKMQLSQHLKERLLPRRRRQVQRSRRLKLWFHQFPPILKMRQLMLHQLQQLLLQRQEASQQPCLLLNTLNQYKRHNQLFQLNQQLLKKLQLRLYPQRVLMSQQKNLKLILMGMILLMKNMEMMI